MGKLEASQRALCYLALILLSISDTFLTLPAAGDRDDVVPHTNSKMKRLCGKDVSNSESYSSY